MKGFADKRTIPYLKDGDASVCVPVARCLNQNGWEPADEREEIRVMVALGDYMRAAALGPTAFDSLVEVLHDKSHSTRRFAQETLADDRAQITMDL